MTDEQEVRNAAYAKIKAETDVLLAEVDELLATRHEPLTNVLPFITPKKPAPPPEPDPIITRMIEELREQLDEHRDYINGELRSLLQEVFTDISSAFDTVGDRFEAVDADMKGFVGKAIEIDIANLQAETASLRADLSSLQTIVGNLSGQIAQLADDITSIERSGGGKIVTLRGSA